MSDTTTMIIDFVQNRFPQAEITADQDIFALGYINSLFAMELVMHIEKAFSVTIPNAELRIDNFRTATAMTELIERLRTAVAVG